MQASLSFHLLTPVPDLAGEPLSAIEAIPREPAQAVYFYGGDPETRDAVAELVQTKGTGMPGPASRARVAVRDFELGRTHYRWSACGDNFVLNVPTGYNPDAAWDVVDQVNATCPDG